MTVSKPRQLSRVAKLPSAAKGSNKYGAKRVVVDGINFASQGEAARYGELKLLEKAGEITNLRLQVPYPLSVYGQLICKYVADFTYSDRDGTLVVEDYKGFRTPEYKIKAKLFEACLGFPIREV